MCYLELEQDLLENKSLAPFEDKYYNEEFTIQLPSQKKITDIKWLAGITLTVAFLACRSGKFRVSGSGDRSHLSWEKSNSEPEVSSSWI